MSTDRTNAHRPATGDAFSRVVTQLRVALALVVLALAVMAALDRDTSRVALDVVCALAVVITAIFESALRRRVGIARVSGCIVALDTIIVLTMLAAHGIGPGEPLALVVVLPLVEAAARHGLFGAIATWLAIAFAIAAQLTATWDGTADRLHAPATLVVLLLVVALPTAHVSQHLGERVDQVRATATTNDRRARVLAHTLNGTVSVTAATPAAREGVIVEHATAIMQAAMQSVTESVAESVTFRCVDGAPADHGARAAAFPVSAHRCLVGVWPAGVHPDPYVIEAVGLLASTAAMLDSADTTTAPHAHDSSVAALPGRREIERTIRSIADAGLRPAVAIVSLDNLSLLNDLYGRRAGDLLVQAAVERLRSMGEVTVGRLAGDELVMVLDGDRHENLTAATAAALDGPVDLATFGATTIHRGIGVASTSVSSLSSSSTSSVSGGIEPSQLIREASEAMFADRREQNARFLAGVADELASAPSPVVA